VFISTLGIFLNLVRDANFFFFFFFFRKCEYAEKDQSSIKQYKRVEKQKYKLIKINGKVTERCERP